MTKNDITGDKLISKKNTDNYRDNYDAIFSKQDEKLKDEKITNYVCLALFILCASSIAMDMRADEIKFGFKSPSFSGVGTSSHYLTIDSQEQTKKDALKAEIKALADAAKREEENTTLARFIKNFESRIYAQLSRQLVDSLFGETPAEEGSFQLFDNLITWTSDGITITMTIFNEATGETTTITIPIGDFGF
tara:strand:- start:109 stop:684 length:576 start_codon:yes stop_codon:yes gene_type:complete